MGAPKPAVAGADAAAAAKAPPKPSRPGDWICPVSTCADLVFGYRTACHLCGAPKPGYSAGEPAPAGGKPGDWICPKKGCRDLVFARRMKCNRCGILDLGLAWPRLPRFSAACRAPSHTPCRAPSHTPGDMFLFVSPFCRMLLVFATLCPFDLGPHLCRHRETGAPHRDRDQAGRTGSWQRAAAAGTVDQQGRLRGTRRVSLHTATVSTRQRASERASERERERERFYSDMLWVR